MKTVEHLPHLFFSGRVRMDSGPYGTPTICNFFKKSMSFYVFREPLFQICEGYIDDLLAYGHDDDFVANVRTIFQKCPDKTVTLSAETLYLYDTIQFPSWDMSWMPHWHQYEPEAHKKHHTIRKTNYPNGIILIPGLGQLFQRSYSATFCCRTLTS